MRSKSGVEARCGLVRWAAMAGVAAVIGGGLVGVGSARADIVYDEQRQGDFSDDRFAPTPLPLSVGSNQLIGIIEGEDGMGGLDRDYFTITIPAGLQLSSILLESYMSTDFAAFAGIQPGAVFPDDPDSVRPGDLMGWTLFGPGNVDQDLLPQIGANGRRFTAPLGAGTYTFWVQQIGPFTDYTWNFEVAVPAPGAVGLLGAAGLVGLRRRR